MDKQPRRKKPITRSKSAGLRIAKADTLDVTALLRKISDRIDFTVPETKGEMSELQSRPEHVPFSTSSSVYSSIFNEGVRRLYPTEEASSVQAWLETYDPVEKLIHPISYLLFKSGAKYDRKKTLIQNIVSNESALSDAYEVVQQDEMERMFLDGGSKPFRTIMRSVIVGIRNEWSLLGVKGNTLIKHRKDRMSERVEEILYLQLYESVEGISINGAESIGLLRTPWKEAVTGRKAPVKMQIAVVSPEQTAIGLVDTELDGDDLNQYVCRYLASQSAKAIYQALKRLTGDTFDYTTYGPFALPISLRYTALMLRVVYNSKSDTKELDVQSTAFTVLVTYSLYWTLQHVIGTDVPVDDVLELFEENNELDDLMNLRLAIGRKYQTGAETLLRIMEKLKTYSTPPPKALIDSIIS